MEDISQEVFSFNFDESIKSIADLKKAVSDYKKELDACAVGSEEAAEKSRKLREAQLALAAAQKGVVDATGQLDESYYALEQKMRALVDAFKRSTDELERAALAPQIEAMKQKLKDMDASIGDYYRNVGNYTKSIQEAFQGIGVNLGQMPALFNTIGDQMLKASQSGAKGFKLFGESVKGVGKSLMSLAANPVGAAILAITTAIKVAKDIFDAFKKSVEGNETASNNMTKALAPLKGIVQAITNVFDDFVEVITAGAAAMGEFVSGVLEFFGIASDEVAQQNELAQMQIELQEIERNNIVENSKLEKEASDLRAKAADKEKYSAEERKKFLEEYNKTQEKITENNLKLAQKELEALEKEGEGNKDNTEYKKKLAEATAKVNRVQTEYNNTLRQSTTLMNNLNKEIKADADEAARKAAETAKAIKQNKENFDKLVDNAESLNISEYEKQTKKITDDATAKRKALEDAYNSLTKKQKKQQKESYESSIEAINENEKKLLAKIEENREKSLKEFRTHIIEITLEGKDKELAASKSKWEAELAKVDETVKQGLITEEEAAQARITINQQAYDESQKILKKYSDAADEATKAAAKKAEEELKKAREKQAKPFIETSELLGDMAEVTSKITSYTDEMSNAWSEMFATLSAGFAELGENLKNGEKDWKTWSDFASKSVAVVGSMFDALADQQDTQTKEGFERQKKLNIASAVMATISGMVSAITESIKGLGVPVGPIVGSALASAIAAMGGVQVANISKTQFDGDGTSQINAASVQRIAAPAAYTQDVQTASLEEMIGTQKIYVSVEEINKKQNSVRTAVTESRF